MGAHWSLLGGHLGPLWGYLGTLSAAFWSLLASLWAPWGSLWSLQTPPRNRQSALPTCNNLNRRLGGIIGSADPNREIGFGFVSCSCRACERARRSCVGVWGDASQRWWLEWQDVRLRRWLRFSPFAAIRKGFKAKSSDLTTLARVLRKFFGFDCIRKGFKEFLWI